MTPLWILLAACGAPSPEPATPTPPGQLEAPPEPTAPDTDAATNELPTRVPAGATALPDALVCPPENPGPYGCFREVPGATVRLGAQAVDPSAPGYDPAARPDEAPVAEVAVATFWLQRNEVLASHVAVCIRDGGCSADDVIADGTATVGVRGKGTLPAVGVSWKAADDFCRWLGGRLPTEAEYELATRGPEGRRDTWGDQIRCNLVDRHPAEAPGGGEADDACAPVVETLVARLGPDGFAPIGEAVGRLPRDEVVAACSRLAALPPDQVEAEARELASAAPAAPPPAPPERCPTDVPLTPGALSDATPLRVDALTGNVREWVADAYTPRGGPALDGPRRLTKGGSFLSPDDELRAAARHPLPADAKLPDVGFRCAWSVAP
jgi:formylglycine-generating enzyme required for sulfatase activity